MAVPVPLGTEDRTARITLRRPEGWSRETPSGADLRLTTGGNGTGGGDVVVTVRSRPSDLGIADESTALLGRLPGSVEGVLVVGCDVWTGADAPGRLVEYTLPSPDDDGDDTFVSHLLLTTGRHRIDVVAERPLRSLAHDGETGTGESTVDERAVPATDDLVFAVLDSVRAVGPVPGGTSPRLEHLSAPGAASPDPRDEPLGPHLGADALATLRSLAGKRWNPAVARTPGGRALVEAGVLGRFGTVPPETAALLAPWAADAEPLTLERSVDGGVGTRLQAWCGATDVTVVDGTDESGYAVGARSPQRVVAMLAGRLGIRPAWTYPFATGRLPSTLVDRRLAGGPDRPDLPAELAADKRLAAFWAAPWAVAHLRRPGRPVPITIVCADGVGFARVGRAAGGTTAFSAAAPANVYRTLVRAVLG